MESSCDLIYWCGFDGWWIGWELGTFFLLFSPSPSFLSPTFSSLSLTSRFQSWGKYWTHELTSQTVLILKYIIPDYTGYLYYGGANVAMNGGIMISYVPSFYPLLLLLDIHFSSSFGIPQASTSLPRCCLGNG